jgi:RimJ/RimL family protein N-acetyltransferase
MKEFEQDNVFETARLKVRRLKEFDLIPFHEMQGDLEVMQYVAKKANTLKEDEKDLKEVIEAYAKDGNEFWVWAIDEKKSSQMLGTLALVKDKEDNWEIGYRFIHKHWGNGYATEVVGGMLEWCESISEIDNLIAYADLRNVASQRVLSKVGFVNLGIKYNDEDDCEDYIYSASTTSY